MFISLGMKEKHTPEMRRMAQLIRRKMLQKNHGAKRTYNRKDKTWKKEP
jgi:hypothetical protein